MTNENNDLVHILDIIDHPVNEEKKTNPKKPKFEDPKPNIQYDPNMNRVFDVSLFTEELRQISEKRKSDNFKHSSNITAYSIAHDCILNVVKKILNYPVKSFADSWLPILMRNVIGSAVHDFIQSSSQFTEIELKVKVPSIRFSGYIDGAINNNCLAEIKSCTYTDYINIVKTQQPRHPDFYQLLTYKYIIENHLKEIKTINSDNLPKLDKYQIKYLQFIYVAHDMFAATVEDFGEALKRIEIFKKSCNSADNKFFFITSIIFDVDTFDTTPYISYITNKIKAINDCVDNNKLPPLNSPYIDTTKCFFCLYRYDCPLKK